MEVSRQAAMPSCGDHSEITPRSCGDHAEIRGCLPWSVSSCVRGSRRPSSLPSRGVTSCSISTGNELASPVDEPSHDCCRKQAQWKWLGRGGIDQGKRARFKGGGWLIGALLKRVRGATCGVQKAADLHLGL